MKKKKSFLKAWSVNDETVQKLEESQAVLESENQSYTLRRLISIGHEQLMKSKERHA